MSSEILKTVEEVEKEIASIVTGKAAVIAARYGKPVSVYYEACIASFRIKVSSETIYSLFVARVASPVVSSMGEAYTEEMVGYVAKACGAAPSLLEEVQKQAEADSKEIAHLLKNLKETIQSKLK